MKGGKIGFFYGIGSQQVANQPFVQGKIFRFGFLGQNSGWFIQQQYIFILIENADILQGTVSLAVIGGIFHCPGTGQQDKGFLGEKAFYRVSLGKDFFAFRFFPVQRNIFLAQHLI